MDPIQNTPLEPTPQPVAPIVPSQKHTNILLLFFVGLSMLLIGFMGGYFLIASKTPTLALPNQKVEVSPTQSAIVTSMPEAANTYTNSTLGISFTYPTGWQTVNPFPGSPDSIAFIGLVPVGTDLKGSVSPIYIEHWDNPKNLSLQEFEKEYNAQSAMERQFYSPDATVSTIAGLTAYTKENAGCEPLSCTRVTIMAKNTIFIFYNVKEDDIFTPAQLAENKVAFDQVLSTLTFTK